MNDPIYTAPAPLIDEDERLQELLRDEEQEAAPSSTCSICGRPLINGRCRWQGGER